jgi:hypothetical protein
MILHVIFVTALLPTNQADEEDEWLTKRASLPV